MGTLFVDERGEQRAFRVSQGTLVVGSGAEAKLRLASEGVAEVHAELEISEGELYVTPRPGVVPPRVQGVDVGGRVRVVPGQELRIGAARIVWRKEEEGAAAPPPRQARPDSAPKSAAAAPQRAAARSRPAGGGAAGRAAPRVSRGTTVRRTPARARGMPAWLTVVLVLGGLGIVVAIVLRGFQKNLDDAERINSRLHLARAETFVEENNFELAEERLAKIVLAELTQEGVARYEQVQRAVEEARVARAVALENSRGDAWFEFKLTEYEKHYLAGDPGLPRIRLFLERCAEFRERWPQHPELAWVGRQERRFSGLPGLDEPLGLDDAEWRAEVLTSARPHDYAGAFEALYAFRETADADGSDAVDRLVAKLKKEREEYHEKQLRFAQGEYEKGNTSRAFEWLVQSILRLGDEGMADEAAEIMVAFPNADALLRGYRSQRTHDFEGLMENRVVAGFARANGIE